MLKEIHEQPAVIDETLKGFLSSDPDQNIGPDMPFHWSDLTRLTMVACGTSYYAALVAKYWFEGLARLPVDVDIASEFRYRTPPLAPDGAAIFISQSGETSDTLAALQYCRDQGQSICSIVNVAESSMDRGSDMTLLTRAGPEIGVASTKAFTTQLSVLAALAIFAAEARGQISAGRRAALSAALTGIPALISEILAAPDQIINSAKAISTARDILYLGRGACYPIALEGALKLKELSYIHAEGYAAGEMKHGPIALIDADVPVIVCAPSDSVFTKTASNVQEVAARGGRVILLSDTAGIAAMDGSPDAVIQLPTVDPFIAPIIWAIPAQLLAYHVAVIKGTDVDQPRNLAKSVTVE